MLSPQQTRAYEEMIAAVVQTVKSRTLVRIGDLAAMFNRTKNFPNAMKRLTIRRGLLTADEWYEGFSGKSAKRFCYRCPDCGSNAKRVRVERIKPV